VVTNCWLVFEVEGTCMSVRLTRLQIHKNALLFKSQGQAPAQAQDQNQGKLEVEVEGSFSLICSGVVVGRIQDVGG
jgi:hypothetical protein